MPQCYCDGFVLTEDNDLFSMDSEVKKIDMHDNAGPPGPPGEGGVIDPTLSHSGEAADAKATGDRIEERTNGEAEEVLFEIAGTGYVRYDTGEISSSSTTSYTDYIDISAYKRLLYKREGSTSATPSGAIAFYDSNKTFISSVRALGSQETAGYVDWFAYVPSNAKYVRCTVYTDTTTYGEFQIKGERIVAYLNHTLYKQMRLNLADSHTAYCSITVGSKITYTSSTASLTYSKIIPIANGMRYKVTESHGASPAATSNRNSVICDANEIVRQVIGHTTSANSTVVTEFTANQDGYLYWTIDVNYVSLTIEGPEMTSDIADAKQTISKDEDVYLKLLMSPYDRMVFKGYVENITSGSGTSARTWTVYYNYVESLGRNATGSTYNGLIITNDNPRATSNPTASAGITTYLADYKPVPSYSNCHLYLCLDWSNETTYTGSGSTAPDIVVLTYNSSGEVYRTNVISPVTLLDFETAYQLPDDFMTNGNIAIIIESKGPKTTIRYKFHLVMTNLAYLHSSMSVTLSRYGSQVVNDFTPST